MISTENLAEETVSEENRPDLIIHQLKELLNVFPVLENQTLKVT